MINKFCLFAFMFCYSSFSQIGMQDWRIHFSSFNAVGIAENETDVYMACANGLIEYDIEDNSINVLTVTNGLSDLGISTIDSDGSVIFVGYINGNLDIIEGNTITNIPWIKKAEIAGDKTINSFYFDGDIVYVATNVGLVLVDNLRKEIKDTYYPFDNPVINDVAVFQDTLYLATDQGIYLAHKDKAFLNDKNQWTKLTYIPAYLQSLDIKEIESFNDILVFSYDSEIYQGDSIYFIENGVFNEFSNNPKEVIDLRADDGKLILTALGAIEVIDATMTPESSIFQIEGKSLLPKSGLFKNNEYWIADQNHGMVRARNSWNNSSVYSNTPFADGSYRIDIQFGTVLVAGGGLTHNLQNVNSRNGVYKFQNEQWTNMNFTNQDSMDFNSNWDYISVVINPNNTDDLAFASSSQGGLMVVKDGVAISEVYNETNSTLERVSGKIVISDMKYDSDGNLWVLNQGLEPLKMLATDGTWYSYTLGSAAKDQYVYRLLIDNDGTKWVGVNHVGLIAFNENGTFMDGSDDQWKTLSGAENYGNLPSLFVKGLVQDIDGEIWIGTEVGMVVLYNTTNVFDGELGEYDANPIFIGVDGEIEKLLGESDITTITIDGGNRKWIGTSSSGVFCLSEDGKEEIYRFTAENSPLISNNIFDIRVDHLSGEVYFATESGLVSFRTDATIGDPEFDDVKVFPNPVRPEYLGPISIQGLGYESDIKITDVSGNVVYKTISNGGTVIWDGKTLQGVRAQSGVYLVWSAVANGKGKNVAKILLIN